MEPGHIFRTKLPFHRNQSQERRVTQARLTFSENPWGLPFFQFTLRRAHASKREFEKRVLAARRRIQNQQFWELILFLLVHCLPFQVIAMASVLVSFFFSTCFKINTRFVSFYGNFYYVCLGNKFVLMIPTR